MEGSVDGHLDGHGAGVEGVVLAEPLVTGRHVVGLALGQRVVGGVVVGRAGGALEGLQGGGGHWRGATLEYNSRTSLTWTASSWFM